MRQSVTQLAIALIGVLVFAAPAVAAKKTKDWMLPKDEEGKYLLKEVVETPGVDADELFDRAMVWIAEAYRSANDVVQYSEKSSHRIIAKGNFTVMLFTEAVVIRHTLKVETKDERYRFTFGDLWQESCDCPFEKWNMEKKETFNKLRKVAADLKEAMTAKGSGGDDDW